MKALFIFLVAFIWNSQAHADAASIRRAADDMRQQAREIDDAKSRLESSTREVESNTRDLESKRQAAESRRMQLDSEISSIQSQATQRRNEAISLNARAAADRAEQKQVDAKVAEYKNKLPQLLKENENLQARLDFHNGELADLKAFGESLARIEASFSALLSKQHAVRSAMDSSYNMHTAWLNQLANIAATFAPPFQTLEDERAIMAARQNIRGFLKAVPDQAPLRTKEDGMLALSRDAATMSSSLQDQLRALASSRGLTVFNKYSPSSGTTGPFWRAMDVAVYRNTDLNLKNAGLINQMRERREFLIRVIPAMWDRMLNVRLDNVSSQSLVQAGTGGLTGIKQAKAVLEINDELTNGRKQAVTLFYKLDCPLLARDRLSQVLVAANRIASASPLPANVKATLSSEIEKARALDAQIAKEAAAGGAKFLNSRRKSAQKIAARNAPTGNCASYFAAITQTSDGRANETAFQKFQEQCQ